MFAVIFVCINKFDLHLFKSGPRKGNSKSKMVRTFFKRYITCSVQRIPFIFLELLNRTVPINNCKLSILLKNARKMDTSYQKWDTLSDPSILEHFVTALLCLSEAIRSFFDWSILLLIPSFIYLLILFHKFIPMRTSNNADASKKRPTRLKLTKGVETERSSLCLLFIPIILF